MKACLTIFLSICNLVVCYGQKKPTTILHDFASLVGNWQGNLTYLDYTSGKPYSMPADLEIIRVDKTNRFAFFNRYPKEQSANAVDTITISDNESFVDKERVKRRKILSNGDVEIVTEEKGKDGNDNRPATFRFTYLIGTDHYSKRKDVQFEGETSWVKRHEYAYKRKHDR